MTPQLISEWLTSLSITERAKALNLISFKLTIRAREHGLSEAVAQGEATIKRLLGINELQHRLSAQAGHYMDGEESTAYPVSVFSQTLFEIAAQYNVTGALGAALKSAMGNKSPAAN